MGFTQVPKEEASSSQSNERLNRLEGFASFITTPKGWGVIFAVILGVYSTYKTETNPNKDAAAITKEAKNTEPKIDPLAAAVIDIATGKAGKQHSPDPQVKQLSDTVAELGKAVKSQGDTVQAIVDMIQKQNDKIDRILPKGKASLDRFDDVDLEDNAVFVQFTKPVPDTASQIAKLLADRDKAVSRLDMLEANAVTKADFEAFKNEIKTMLKQPEQPDLPMPQPMPPAAQSPPVMTAPAACGSMAGPMMLAPRIMLPRMQQRKATRRASAGGC